MTMKGRAGYMVFKAMGIELHGFDKLVTRSSAKSWLTPGFAASPPVDKMRPNEST